MDLTNIFWGVWCVWKRFFDLYRKNLSYAVVTTCVEPLLYLFSLGFGLGSLIGIIAVDDRIVSYRQFILTGLVAQALLFQSFFEAAYGGYIRMVYQKIYHMIAITPITLSEVLWGELFWDATKATISASLILIIGVCIGDLSPLGALMVLPFCFFAAALFSGLGLLVAGKAKDINEVSYPQYLIVMPMFLFCGIFFPLQHLPLALQYIVWALPLTSVVAIIRWLTLDFPLPLQAFPMVLFWLILLVTWARRTVRKRLIN